jgi:hypothetical protein
MTTQPNRRRRGQAIVLVTLALFAMCGLLGLAVDLGWAYFVKKSAQASADAGALGAAYVILGLIGQTQPFQAEFGGLSGTCSSEGGDPGLSSGCEYAQQAGFAGTISMTSGAYSAPPTVPNLTSRYYWATARAVETIPQLFSAVLGNPTGISSARATAAVVQVPLNGALHTLNRQYDLIATSGLPQGADIGGNGSIIVPSGLMISSQSLTNAGSGVSVTGPITIVSPGNASGLGGSSITGIGDSGQFLDPYRDIGQPVLPSSAAQAGTLGPLGPLGTLPTYGVVNGRFTSGVYLLSGSQTQGSGVASPFPSGNYVAIKCSPCGNGGMASVDAADQITLTQSATFSDSVPTCYPTTSSTFGCFFFYGGVSLSPGVTMTMGAGEFVMVGGGSSGMDFIAPSSAFLDSQVSCPSPSSCSTAGVILIMTGSSSAITCTGNACNNANQDLYPNLATQISSNPLIVQAATTTTVLNFGSVYLLAGADSPGAAVTGLVAKNLPLNLPPSNPLSLANTLGPFDGVVLFQDQANSTMEFTWNSSCTGTIDYPCPETSHLAGTEAMTLQAAPGTGIQGVVYQPRGAFLQNQGGTIQGPIQIFTGAILMQGGTINVTLPPTSVKRLVVTLVE